MNRKRGNRMVLCQLKALERDRETAISRVVLYCVVCVRCTAGFEGWDCNGVRESGSTGAEEWRTRAELRVTGGCY